MGLYVNQKQIRILVLLSIVAIAAFLCGCTGTKDDNSSEGSVNTELLGTWSMIEEAENSSLKIIYTFYSNFSFFSGVQNMSSKLYDFSLWGSYSPIVPTMGCIPLTAYLHVLMILLQP